MRDRFGENGVRKGVIIAALALVSLLALNGTVFMAFATAPTVDVIPVSGFLGESFNIDITATSESTASGIKVKDPDGNIWVLMGFSSGVWDIVTIWLPDAGDKVRLVWPEVSMSIFSVEHDENGDVKITRNGSPITDLAWRHINYVPPSPPLPPHTSVVGTYQFWFAGSGCTYLKVVSLLVVPEGPLGTLSFLLICVASLAMYKRVRRPQVKL